MGLLTADTVASQGLPLSRCKGAKGEQTPAGWTLWARSNGGGWSEAWVGSGENRRKLIVTQKMGGVSWGSGKREARLTVHGDSWGHADLLLST